MALKHFPKATELTPKKKKEIQSAILHELKSNPVEDIKPIFGFFNKYFK